LGAVLGSAVPPSFPPFLKTFSKEGFFFLVDLEEEGVFKTFDMMIGLDWIGFDSIRLDWIRFNESINPDKINHSVNKERSTNGVVAAIVVN